MKHRVICATIVGWWLSIGTSGASTVESYGLCNAPMEPLEHVLFGPLTYALLMMVLVCSGLAWALTDHHVAARRIFAGVLGGAFAVVLPDITTALGWTGALF